MRLVTPTPPPSPLFVAEGQADRICIMAPGPSLTREQVDMVMSKGLMTIAIGDAWTLNPLADILYHCDKRWWDYYKGVPQFAGGQRVSFDDTKMPNVHHILRSKKNVGIDLTPSTVCLGNNSGFQAIGIALHYKPKEIILIGYDMKESASGKYNVIGNHPTSIKGMTCFLNFIHTIGLLVKPLEESGVIVYNCTIDTALKCFPQKDLKDVL